MPSRLLLLPVLSCQVQQLVVWVISADRAVGEHGSRADSPPPVAHYPTPLYVPTFMFLIESKLYCPLSPKILTVYTHVATIGQYVIYMWE